MGGGWGFADNTGPGDSDTDCFLSESLPWVRVGCQNFPCSQDPCPLLLHNLISEFPKVNIN